MYHAFQAANSNIIEVKNELDIVSSPALESAIDIAAQSAHRHIVVSLEHCTFCDSTALGVLVRAKKNLGVRFIVVLPAGNQVNRVFDLTGLTTYLKPFASLQQAIDSSNAAQTSAPPSHMHG